MKNEIKDTSHTDVRTHIALPVQTMTQLTSIHQWVGPVLADRTLSFLQVGSDKRLKAESYGETHQPIDPRRDEHNHSILRARGVLGAVGLESISTR